jgi:hypothetical protein
MPRKRYKRLANHVEEARLSVICKQLDIEHYLDLQMAALQEGNRELVAHYAGKIRRKTAEVKELMREIKRKAGDK